MIADVATSTEPVYTQKSSPRDGIGKVYLGREISHVMGHRGAAWLERKSRVREELPDQAVQARGLLPDSVVADIGAGTGYFTFRMAALVPQGRVYPVDIQAKMLAIIRKRVALPVSLVTSMRLLSSSRVEICG